MTTVKSIDDSARSSYLDLARGMAAILVLLSHLRAFVFVNWSAAIDQNIVNACFYFVTSLGHQAVMIFFVLSGYLVGGSVIESWKHHAWSWKKYSVNRLARLWTVLLPALLATALWDYLGLRLIGHSLLDGHFWPILNSGPTLQYPADLSLSALFFNAVFLQMILSEPYGTNGPLWSLSYEFWYYVLFPLILCVVRDRLFVKAISAITIILLISWLPTNLLQLAPVWIFGVVAVSVHRSGKLRFMSNSRAMSATACIIFAFAIWFGRLRPSLFSDLALGATFASLLVSLGSSSSSAKPCLATKFLADISYSLYLFHFPFLAFIWLYFMAPYQLQPSVLGYGIFSVFFTIAMIYTLCAWWCFERNTWWLKLRLRGTPKISF